jgi:hydroxymethylbilane synthase
MTAAKILRVGTRGSALARSQTGLVVDALGVAADVVPITTSGDRSTATLRDLVGGTPASGGVAGGGGTGVFVSALRTALLAGEIDVAVHSCKDLPVAAADGIELAAVPRREDPRDALVARDRLTLAQLPPGARVGTGSPRRAAQLRALGLDLEIVDLRGNVDTRLGTVESGELDAVVLAHAGLRRLGRQDMITELLDPLQLLPAPAQGALAVECRAGDERVRALLQALDDPDSRAAITAERAVLAGLEAGCSAPVGALAEIVESDAPDGATELEVFLRASVTAVDGGTVVRLSATGAVSEADGVGRRLAADLLAEGADHIMAATLASGPDGMAATSGRDRESSS